MTKYLQIQKIYSLNRKHNLLYHRFVRGEISAEQVRIEARKISEEDQVLLTFTEDNEKHNRAPDNPPNDEQLPV